MHLRVELVLLKLELRQELKKIMLVLRRVGVLMIVHGRGGNTCVPTLQSRPTKPSLGLIGHLLEVSSFCLRRFPCLRFFLPNSKSTDE